MEPILSMLTSGMTSPPAGGPNMANLTTSMGQMNMGGQPGMMQQQPMGKKFSFNTQCTSAISLDDSLLYYWNFRKMFVLFSVSLQNSFHFIEFN